jgi:hypothetical protein
MKKTTLTILALTLSLNAFACWGPKSGFWNDWSQGMLIPAELKKAAIAPKSQELKALVPITISNQNYLLSLFKQLLRIQSNLQ